MSMQKQIIKKLQRRGLPHMTVIKELTEYEWQKKHPLDPNNFKSCIDEWWEEEALLCKQLNVNELGKIRARKEF